MKERQEKQKFKESKIGKIIYGFLMFMPILAIGVTCGYAIFNKNAYQSYGDEYIQNTQKVDNNTLLVNGEEYYISYRNIGNLQLYNDTRYYYSTISINWVDFGAPSNNTYIGFEINSYQNPNNRIYVYYLDNNNVEQRITLSIWGSRLKEFYFTLENTVTLATTNFNNQSYNLYLLNYKLNKVSDVFYYSVDKVEQSNLFNWTKTSNIYTGMHNFTTAMNVTNTFIPMLLTYWLIISVIYFLYDIALILVSILHKRIHNLQDSL